MLLALSLLLPRPQLSAIKLGPTDVPEPAPYGKVPLLERNWVVVVDQGPTTRGCRTRREKFECASAYDIAHNDEKKQKDGLFALTSKEV